MECSEGCPRGFHREKDGRAMTGAQAYGAWVPAAKEILTEIAGAPGTITYTDLAIAVQERTGISAGQVPLAEWIGRVGNLVSQQPGAEELVKIIREPVGIVKPKQTRAKVVNPVSASNAAKANVAKAKPKAEEVELAVCPIHFLQVSASGQCGECE